MSIFLLVIVIVIAVLMIYSYFNIYSATTGMIRANLSNYFKARLDDMNSEDAMHFMILRRYGLWPKKRGEFVTLYALFISYLENPEVSGIEFPVAFGVLSIILGSFHLHHEIPENIGEKGKKELEMLRCVISLMHIYEAGAIFKSPQSVGFPPVKFLDNFIHNIDKEYGSRL